MTSRCRALLLTGTQAAAIQESLAHPAALRAKLEQSQPSSERASRYSWKNITHDAQFSECRLRGGQLLCLNGNSEPEAALCSGLPRSDRCDLTLGSPFLTALLTLIHLYPSHYGRRIQRQHRNYWGDWAARIRFRRCRSPCIGAWCRMPRAWRADSLVILHFRGLFPYRICHRSGWSICKPRCRSYRGAVHPH